jgi:GTPase SAR1 family protein
LKDVIRDFINRPMHPFNHSRICVVGRGGSGKTSLLFAIRGNTRPSSRVPSTMGFESSVCEIHNTTVDGRGEFKDMASDKHTESARAVARSIRSGNTNPLVNKF